MFLKKSFAFSCLAGTVLAARAACPGTADAARLAAFHLQRQVIDNPAELSIADAQCGRDRYVALLGQQLSAVAGYKAGLTNPAVQKRFNHDQPVRGTLFKDMLLSDGAEVPARFGARPLYEADLLVRVKDAGIHQAKTAEEVMKHIDAVIPFIELPDLMVQEPSRLNGATLTYLNVAARLGVMGTPVPMASLQPAQLADMTVRILDGQNQEVERGRGSDIMGHPLNAVIWLAQDLARAGGRLRKGDLLSLGSFSKLRPPQAGQDIRVVYEGLPGTPAVSVRFR